MNSRYQDSLVKALAAAIVLGGFVGISSLAEPEENEPLPEDFVNAPFLPGTARGREPEPGDQWSRCDDARAIGTSPLYRGEPGYRASLDKDGDGIACEPYAKPE